MEKILFVDDDPTIRKGIQLSLGNHDLTIAGTPEEAVHILKSRTFDLLLTDLYMPKEDSGLSLVGVARDLDEDLYIVVLTAFGSIETAVRAVKAGADDFLTKELSFEEIRHKVDTFLKAARKKRRLRVLEAENILLKQELHLSHNLIGDSDAMRSVQKQIDAAAGDDSCSVLILGRSGTGKEITAREIHKRSRRNSSAFIPIDCPSIPLELFEAELFGYEKGAFTDAKSRKVGRVELAHQGTLFLDEIADLPPPLQAKLLRFLETGEFYRIGGTRPLSVNVRVIASTNRVLKDMISTGAFREDLYYRLRIIEITLPPLTDRKDDIPLLVDYFLNQINQKKKTKLKLTGKNIDYLKSHSWPGNVRELKNALICYSITGCFPTPAKEFSAPAFRKKEYPLSYKKARREAVADFEKDFFRRALERNQGNVTRTAREIGLSREELSRRINNPNREGV